MDSHFLTKKFCCVDLVYNPGRFSPRQQVNLVIDYKERYHKRAVLVDTFEYPPQIISYLKKNNPDKLEPVLMCYPRNSLKIITLPIDYGCGWFVDLDLDFFV